EELAVGAIASGGIRGLNEDVARAIPHSERVIEMVTAMEMTELERREQLYRNGRPSPELYNRIAILIDHGLATGPTRPAAVKALRERGAEKVVAAGRVGPRDPCREFERAADEVICAAAPPHFHAVGQYYEDFSQTSDEEVRELLSRAAEKRA